MSGNVQGRVEEEVRFMTRNKGRRERVITGIRAAWLVWLLVSNIEDDTLDGNIAREAICAYIFISSVVVYF